MVKGSNIDKSKTLRPAPTELTHAPHPHNLCHWKGKVFRWFLVNHKKATLGRGRAAIQGPCHGLWLKTKDHLMMGVRGASSTSKYTASDIICTLSDSMYSPLGTMLIFLLKLVMVHAKSWWTSSSLSEREIFSLNSLKCMLAGQWPPPECDVPLPGIFHFFGGIGTGIAKNWYRKKVSEPVSDKFDTGTDFRCQN